MHSNPNVVGMTATEKVKSKIPGTTEHAITHPHHGTGMGTGHMHTPTGSHTALGHESMVTGPTAPMAGGMGGGPMVGSGIAQPAVGTAVPGQIGHHPMHPAGHHHTHGVGHHGVTGSTAGMSTTQKIASKVPGTTEYKMTH